MDILLSAHLKLLDKTDEDGVWLAELLVALNNTDITAL